MLDRPKTDLWFGTKGPPDAPIVFVGESWGEAEKAKQLPFVGSSGIELDRILDRAEVPRDKILFTNVISDQPRGNEMWRFFLPSASKPTRVGGLAPSDQIRSEVCRLYSQILAFPRRLIIASGNYALWALSQVTDNKKLSKSNNRPIPKELQTWVPSGILSWRGSMWFCEPQIELFPPGASTNVLRSIKLLPLVHPAAIMRAWYLRDPTIHDLRVRVPLAFQDDWRPNPDYEFLAPPTFEQCIAKLRGWLELANHHPIRLASDIETARTLITCLGFADSERTAMSIPFIHRAGEKGAIFGSWWTPEQEAQITDLIRRIYTHPGISIDGQNFIYDTQYIQYYMGVSPHLDHDTMLHQNTCFPGTPKALDYLSSLYCHYHWYWKEDHKEWDMKGSIEDLLRYNCLDLVRTWEIGGNQRQITATLDMEEQFQFKMKTNDLCLRMMNRGVLVDQKKRISMLMECQDTLAQLHRELLEIIPQEWVGPVRKRSKQKGGGEIYWITSDTQQKLLFYELLGFKVVKDLKTGMPTTGKKALGQFKIWYPEFAGLFKRLSDAASIEQTCGVLQSRIDFDGRLRCSYKPGGAETHRLSSAQNAFGGGTNLQNVTKGNEDSKSSLLEEEEEEE